MSSLFHPDSPIMSGLSKLTDMLVLNLIFILCCIPILTIGASVTALYDAVDRIMKDEGNIYKAFFRAFRSNFKQATIQWFILLFTGSVLTVCLYYYLNSEIAISQVLLWVAVFMAFIWCAVAAWVFPLQAKFYNTIKNTFRNAMVCAIAYLPRTIVMIVLNLLPFAMVLLSPTLFSFFSIIFLFIWFSLVASSNLKLTKKAFQTMIEQLDSEEAATADDSIANDPPSNRR